MCLYYIVTNKHQTMKKVISILITLTICYVAFAQTPQKGDFVYTDDSTRYIIWKVGEYDYEMIRYTYEDTLDYADIQTVKYRSKWFEFDKTTYCIGFYVGGGNTHNILGAPNSNALQFGIEICGFVYDMFSRSAPHSNSLQVGYWNETAVSGWHIGYNIPIYRYFYVTPLIGECQYLEGVVDGYDYWFSANEYGATCHNRFNVTKRYGGFDYGAKATFMVAMYKAQNRPTINFTASVTVTKYTFGAALGLQCDLKPVFK